MSRPTFIYVGAPKAGSSWLFEALVEHPDVFVTPEKSTTYFEASEVGPIEDYLALFEAAGDAHARGEIAHDTFLNAEAARRIRDAFPDMKILCCLREPGDFARSVIQWWATHTTRFGKTPAEMLKHDRMQRLLDYPARIGPFYEAFPPEQIKIMFFDDLRRDPASFLQDILAFLEVDKDFRISAVDRVINPASRARFGSVTHLAYSVGGLLRLFGFGGFVEAAKRNRLVKRLLYTAPEEDEAVFSPVMEKVRNSSAEGLERLERLIGRPVPEGWKQK